MLDVLAFKSSLFKGVLDNGENEIFMKEGRFNRFMQSVEQVANVSQTQEVLVTDEEEMEQIPSSATEVFTAAETFFGMLAKTLADKEKTGQLVSSLIEKDSATGKRYLKIPVENEQIIEKAADVLTGLLSILKKQ